MKKSRITTCDVNHRVLIDGQPITNEQLTYLEEDTRREYGQVFEQLLQEVHQSQD